MLGLLGEERGESCSSYAWSYRLTPEDDFSVSVRTLKDVLREPRESCLGVKLDSWLSGTATRGPEAAVGEREDGICCLIGGNTLRCIQSLKDS